MEKSNYIYDLYLHMQWADSKVLQSILTSVEAEADDKIKSLFLHIYMVQHAYFCIWENLPVEIPDGNEFNSISSVAGWGKEIIKKICSRLEHMDEKSLSNFLEIPWLKQIENTFGKQAGAVTISESFLQVALHSAYHRGQINLRLRQCGVEPPLVDYIFWIINGRPL